jgi:hypothetical protein
MRTPACLALAVLLVLTPGAAAAVRGDFNGDGKPDIVWSNPVTGANAIWLMNGTTLQSVVDLPGLPVGYSVQATADFNADGHNDLVVRNVLTGANAIWLMNGTSFSSIVDLPGVAELREWTILGAGPFNGDSSPDLFFRPGARSGGTYVWLMQGTAYASSYTSIEHNNANVGCRLATFANFEAVADLNGDGWMDAVMTYTDSGKRALELFANREGIGYYCLPSVSNLSIMFAGGADFNADGKTDLLLRDVSTGANAVWLMDGTTFLGVVDLPALPNTDYVIGGPR